jgi:hypothetical protein
VALFALWFSDIQRLKQLAAPRLDDGRDRQIRYLALHAIGLSVPPSTCKYTKVYTQGMILTVTTQKGTASPSARSRSRSPSTVEVTSTRESEHCKIVVCLSR